MDVRCKLATAVSVAEKVSDNCEYDTDGLEGGVKPGADNLKLGCKPMWLYQALLEMYPKNHASRKYEAEREDLYGNVHP